jgi:RNA polymerase sigma factor (sigma-70 family)
MIEELAAPKEFDEFYPRLFVRAQRSAQRILHDRDQAEDIAAETMARALVAWTKVSTYPEAWVTRTAVNRAIDVYRRRPPPPQPPPGDDADDTVVSRMVLYDALKRLPRRQREVLAMRYLLGMSEGDVAATLGVGPETVRSHVRRGLRKLRTTLNDPTEVIHVADQPT